MNTLPVVLPTALAAFGSVTMALLVLGQFHTFLVWSIGLVAAYFAARYVYRLTVALTLPGSRNEQNYCTTIVLVGIGLWVIVNAALSSQHIFTDRDPGVYATTGAWLVNHTSLRIPRTGLFSNLPGIVTKSGGFGTSAFNPKVLFAQGDHLLPALLGLAGRLGGYGFMLRFNALLGGISLLAIYGFARLIMKPRWAMAAVGCLALSLPFIYFSRDTYTEPLAAALTFNALALLWLASKTKRYGAWFLAGVVTGAGLLTRIDAYLTLAAVEAFLIAMLALAKQEDRLSTCRQVAAWAAGAMAVGVVAWTDLYYLSNVYYQQQWQQLRLEFMLIIALLFVGGLFVLISWKTKFLSWLDDITRARRPATAAVATPLFCVVLISRPLWYTGYQPLSSIIGGTSSLPIRTYAEQTMNWLAWYLGPVMLVFGILGLSLGAARAVKEHRLELVPLLIAVLGVSAVYLINPNIAGDQIWAARRLVPVIMPGFAIFGALFLQQLYATNTGVLIKFTPKINRKLATTIALLAIGGSLLVSYPFLKTRTYVPELSQVETVCQHIPNNAVTVWLGGAQQTGMQTVASFCNTSLPPVGARDVTVSNGLLANLASSNENKGKQVIIALYSSDLQTLPVADRTAMTPIGTINYQIITPTYGHFPTSYSGHSQTIMLGTLSPSGDVVPLGRAA
ncbi:MAG TPA: glycosyltransferase family 39 protein [Verrucomicrobiae bacterium]|nr:glycosyltransferase family 39 protein [Verrucomicrobiae bacterium]